MDKIKKVVRSTKKFVSDHKVAVTVVATVPVYVWLHQHSIRDLTDFLKERDLYEEFLIPED